MLKEFSWKTLVAITVAPWIVCASALAQENTGGVFEGKVVLKPVGDDPFVPSFRLQETLLFRQGGGMEWISPEGAIVDGRSVPPLFVQLTSGIRSRAHTARAPSLMTHAVKIKEHDVGDSAAYVLRSAAHGRRCGTGGEADVPASKRVRDALGNARAQQLFQTLSHRCERAGVASASR